jgi:cytochrome c-type biogenesis protein
LEPDQLSLLVAFGAGVLSFLSPCVLPLVPIYISQLAGSSFSAPAESRRWVALLNSLAFGLGFSLVFVGFWASIGLVGYVLPEYADLLRQVGGVALIVLGVHQMGILRIPLLYRTLRFEPNLDTAATPITSVVMGLAFGAGWTPCIGPVLAGIIGLATMSSTVWQGAHLLIAYSLGLGLPFFLTALAISRATLLLKRMYRYLGLVSIASGVLLVAIGVMMLSNTFRLLPQYFNWGGV